VANLLDTLYKARKLTTFVVEKLRAVVDTYEVPCVALHARWVIDDDGNIQVLLTPSSDLNASNLASGTLPDGRFPATLPAASGTNLTNLSIASLTAGADSALRIKSDEDGDFLQLKNKTSGEWHTLFIDDNAQGNPEIALGPGEA